MPAILLDHSCYVQINTRTVAGAINQMTLLLTSNIDLSNGGGKFLEHLLIELVLYTHANPYCARLSVLWQNDCPNFYCNLQLLVHLSLQGTAMLVAHAQPLANLLRLRRLPKAGQRIYGGDSSAQV